MCQSRNINSWLLDKDTSHGPILDETSKTKDMRIDFRTHTHKQQVTAIKGQTVE